MTSPLARYAQMFAEEASHMIWGTGSNVLSATPKSLEWALKQNKSEIPKYKFTESGQTYTILEFAIKCGDLPAVTALVELGMEVEGMLHFYMGCLKEDTEPNLDLLNYLIKQIPDINVEEGDNRRTPLECALQNMASYKEIHWNVIETLLHRGSRVTENHYLNRSLFEILKGSDDDKIQYDRMARTYEEEISFLARLVRYAALEKKYHPESKCSMTLEEFKFHTSNQKMIFTTTAISLDTSFFISEHVGFLSQDLENPDFLKESKSEASEEELAALKEMVHSCENDSHIQQMSELKKISNAFILYHSYFKPLVKEGDFKECFEPWELNSLLPVIEKKKRQGNKIASVLWNRLMSWGVVQIKD